MSVSFIISLGFESVCIVTNDTDILALRSYYSQKLAGRLYIDILTNPKRLFDFSKIQLNIFICEFYGKQSTTKLNDAGYQMFCGKRKSPDTERISPTRDDFMLHLKLANYVTRIWKQALICYPEKLNPADHG